MTYRELTELLYQETQPLGKVEGLTKIIRCKDELPKADGEYLIYHTKYGYCIYGFTVKDDWGCDNVITCKDGSILKQVTHWGKLDFLEKD